MLLSLVDFRDDVFNDLVLLIAAPNNGGLGLAEKGNGAILVGQEGVDALLLMHVGGVIMGAGWIE